jgi:hypothetical protein
MYVPFMMLAQACAITAIAGESPIQSELLGEFATFVHRDHSGNRIGYRFHEHTPLVYGDVPQTGEGARQVDSSAEAEADRFRHRPGVKTHRKRVDEEGWIPQVWTFYLAPIQDGIDMLLVVEAEDTGLPEFYGIQQCFRLSGATNAEWRQKYACTPAFSEYDLWAQTPGDAGKTSLTWLSRGGALQQLPACKETVGCRTRYGEAIDVRRSGGRLDTLTHVGPYNARMLETADSGLVLRTSHDRSWSCGIYWERSTHLTNHHPADCLHAIVNIGGVPPHSKRAVQGKIYWLRGSGEKLVRHWRRDFPNSE